MAGKRCSNCEKSVKLRKKDGFIVDEGTCKALGTRITGEKFYEERECEEFLSRIEYSAQFRTITDKLIKGLAVSKNIKDIIK